MKEIYAVRYTKDNGKLKQKEFVDLEDARKVFARLKAQGKVCQLIRTSKRSYLNLFMALEFQWLGYAVPLWAVLAALFALNVAIAKIFLR